MTQERGLRTPAGSLLRQYREAAGLTQEDLAEQANISVRSISNIECGVTLQPRLDTLRRLTEALKLSSAQSQVFRATYRLPLPPHSILPDDQTPSPSMINDGWWHEQPGRYNSADLQEPPESSIPSPTQPVPPLAELHTPPLSSPHMQRLAPTPPRIPLPTISPNLPVPITSLIGREPDIVALTQFLMPPACRLLTLTGLGGVGKTCLARQVAWQMQPLFADGAAMVSLGALGDSTLVAATIATSLGLDLPAQTLIQTPAPRPTQESESGPALGSSLESKHDDQPTARWLRTVLHERQLFLVVDNCEHLLPTLAPLLADLLSSCPYLTILATSRTALHLQEESVYILHPLAYPSGADLQMFALPAQDDDHEDDCAERSQAAQAAVAAFETTSAVALFVDRARRVDPTFALNLANARAIAAICERLDGLPLAIELAAARCVLFSPQALLGRLSKRLPLLTGGAYDRPARQQTLRNTLAWSYHLLPPSAQQLFRLLASFVGDWTLEAANAVFGAAYQRDSHESHDNNESPDWSANRKRNMSCDLPSEGGKAIWEALTTLIDHHLVQPLTRQTSVAVGMHHAKSADNCKRAVGADGEPRFEMLETVREYAQECLEERRTEAIRIRWQHASYYAAFAETAEPQLNGPEQIMWSARLDEEQGNLRAALRWSLDTHNPQLALRLGNALTRFWARRGYLSEGRAWLEEALALGEPVASVAADGRKDFLERLDDVERSEKWQCQAIPRIDGRGSQASAGHHEREGTQQPSDVWTSCYAQALACAGVLAAAQNDVGVAVARYEQSLALRQALGDTLGAAHVLNNLGECWREQGECLPAIRCFEQSLAFKRWHGDTNGITNTLNNLGLARKQAGDLDGAEHALVACLAQCRAIGDTVRTARALANLGTIAYCKQQYPHAQQLLEESLKLWRTLDDVRGLQHALGNLGEVLCVQRDWSRALVCFREALQLNAQAGIPLGIIEGVEHIAVVYQTWRQTLSAVRLWGAAAVLRQQLDLPVLAGDQEWLGSAWTEARQLVGEAAFMHAWQEGGAWTIDRTIHEATAHMEAC